MKAKTYKIDSETEKEYCLLFVSELPVDGSLQVTIQNVDKSATTKQRGLKWRWSSDIAKSGIGRHDNAQDVHDWNKMKFGHEILMRDSGEDDFYPQLFTIFRDTYQNHENYPAMLKYFAHEHIKTEKFTRAQNAEYLTNVKNYWLSHGVNLTDPDEFGKDLLKLV